MAERLYSTEEVCSLLSIHPSTLRRWRAKLSIDSAPDPAHLARKIYTEEHVIILAEAHHRIALLATLQLDKIEALEKRVRALEFLCGGSSPV